MSICQINNCSRQNTEYYPAFLIGHMHTECVLNKIKHAYFLTYLIQNDEHRRRKCIRPHWGRGTTSEGIFFQKNWQKQKPKYRRPVQFLRLKKQKNDKKQRLLYIFVSFRCRKTKREIPNLIVLIFCCCCNLKREETRLSLLLFNFNKNKY